MPIDLPDYSTAVFRPDDVLAGSPHSYSSGVTTQDFTVPVGVHVISIVLPGYRTMNSLFVVGKTSGIDYLGAFPAGDIVNQIFYAIVSPSADPVVTVQFDASAPGVAYLAGVHDTVAVAVQPVTAAPWQTPNEQPVPLTFGNPGPSGIVTILSAPAGGGAIFLHTLAYIWTTLAANTFGAFTLDNGTEIYADNPGADISPRSIDFRGQQLTPGHGIQWRQLGSAAASATFIQGTLTYSIF